MAKLQRPENEEEFHKREAIGVIRASRFVNNFAKSKALLSLDVIFDIHKEIFKEAWPDIAGELRSKFQTDIKKLFHHTPPPYHKVSELTKIARDELEEKLKNLKTVPLTLVDAGELTEEEWDTMNVVIEVAAWLHHKIVHIHPFVEGNGRTARLAANLILQRYGLIGISIKIEAENKNGYRMALKQIDTNGDYEPLTTIIVEGLIDRYRGVSNKNPI
ncbi:MAG: Fic family protein [Parcubacteria group bacterium]|nr:Fic family protein [Parcubacteria group bacterium]